LDSSGSEQSPIAGLCQYGNLRPGSIKGGEYFHCRSDCWFPPKMILLYEVRSFIQSTTANYLLLLDYGLLDSYTPQSYVWVPLFRRNLLLPSSTLKTEAAKSSEKLVITHKTARYHNSESCNLSFHRQKNPKSKIFSNSELQKVDTVLLTVTEMYSKYVCCYI
jgi:hypothetical protein